MPRLIQGPWVRYIKPYLHDFVVRSQHCLADKFYPWMRDQIEKATDVLRMDLHVMTISTAAHRTARTLECVVIKTLYLDPELINPRRRKCAFQPGNPVPI